MPDLDLEHPSSTGRGDHQPVVTHLRLLTGPRDPPDEAENQPADRVPITCRQFRAERDLELGYGNPGIDPPPPCCDLLYGAGPFFSLVGYIPHQFFNDILDGHDAGGAAVLVDRDREVAPRPLHLAQQLQHPLAFRDHQDLMRQFSDRIVEPIGEVSGQVTEPHYAGHLVWITVMNGQTAVTGLDGDVERLPGKRVGTNRDNVGARHEDLIYSLIPDPERPLH
jgi:hypothetical protein